MSKIGFNQVPIEPSYNPDDPVIIPASDKAPPRTIAYRDAARRSGVTVWRIPDPFIDGFLPNPTDPLPDYEKAGIGALCEFLIQNGSVALLPVGSAIPRNTSNWRSACGGDVAWRQVNFGYWSHCRLPQQVWSQRLTMAFTILDYYKTYFRLRGLNWKEYIQLELANEPNPITTPANARTTVVGNLSVGEKRVTLSSTAAYSAGDWITVEGAGAWQSFQVASKTASFLTIASGTCSSNWGNTTSNGLVIAVADGTYVNKAQFRESYFGSLDSKGLDEIGFDAESYKTRYPELFLWGPSWAAGNPNSISTFFSSGVPWEGLIDGHNYHLYHKHGSYVGDEQFHGVTMPTDDSPVAFARAIIATHLDAIANLRQHTSKPLMCGEFGFAGIANSFSQAASGTREWLPRSWSQHFAEAWAAMKSLPLEHAVYWGPDRTGISNGNTTLDWMSKELDPETSPTLYSWTGSLFGTNTVPAAYVNAGTALV